MTLRNLITLVFAAALGLVALLLMRGYIASHSTARAEPRQATTPVVVAVAPIKRSTTLKPDMLKVVQYPRASVPQGAFSSVEQVVRAPDGAARSALRDLVSNEPIVTSKVSGPDSRANLAGVLAPGMRAVSVKSGEVAGVGGFVLPGDRVDILVTRPTGSGPGASSLVQALAENVRVMGVDQSSDADEPTVAKAVTVEVTPDQAQAISLAQAIGSVSLSLRQADDSAPLSRRAMTVADLGPGGRAAPRRRSQPPQQPAGPSIRVTRGVAMATYSIN